MKSLDFDALARVFCAVRASSDENTALRVAFYAARMMSPGLLVRACELPVGVRLSKVFSNNETIVRRKAEAPMSEQAVVVAALKLTVAWIKHPGTPILGDEVIEAEIAAACARECIERAALINSGRHDVAAIRHRLWSELKAMGVGPARIGRIFRRHHTTITDGQEAHEARMAASVEMHAEAA